MGEKDITEKILADYNDVFADIVNVLLFGFFFYLYDIAYCFTIFRPFEMIIPLVLFVTLRPSRS